MGRTTCSDALTTGPLRQNACTLLQGKGVRFTSADAWFEFFNRRSLADVRSCTIRAPEVKKAAPTGCQEGGVNADIVRRTVEVQQPAAAASQKLFAHACQPRRGEGRHSRNHSAGREGRTPSFYFA
ncbi:unnamed protein product [Rangifer tarandus platyrhynchus]|uniref:HTH CENPB-type domain-containing protein n=1 Tax=Rangifer tarandus platyrhynchus TaxID=3082113 RepID=A0ABN8XJP1_RANTA|nr:unnamed protein product [Rangifer tarandus platyrhynchus]